MQSNYLELALLGIKILQEDSRTFYNQKTLKEQLEIVGCSISKPTINKFVNYKKHQAKGDGTPIGREMKKKMAEGIQQLIQLKLNMVYDLTKGKFIQQEGTIKTPIDVPISYTSIPVNIFPEGIQYHIGGRRDEEDKIALMQGCQKGDIIIEMGLRLRSFSTYFTTRRDDKFKDHIEKLLKKGIHLHCLFLNHEGDFAKPYFEDRAIDIPKEQEAFDAMPNILLDLKKMQEEFNQKNYLGRVELYQYNSTPQYHALVAKNKMYITHYIYGIERRNCPVLEIHQEKQPLLFNKYLRSIEAIKKRAKLVE